MQRLLSLTAVLAATTLTIQESGLLPVAPHTPGAPHPPATADPGADAQEAAPLVGVPAPSADDWRAQLEDPDFGVRAAALEAAAGLVRQDAAFRGTVEAWAADRSLGELAWTAFLVLREADRAPADTGWPNGDQLWAPFGTPGGPHWTPPNGIPEDSYNPFIQAPGGLFGDDPLDVFGPGFFEQFPGDFDFDFGSTPGLPDGATGQSHQVTIGPDGVTIRVEATGPDGTETREYTADSIEDLRADSPELFEPGGALEGLELGTGGSLFGGGLRVLPHGFPQGVPVPAIPEPPVVGGPVTRTDVLGVMVASAAAGQAPGSPPAPAATSGLLVESVVAGTIAAHVGLEPGDLVIELAGQRVRTAAEVSAALAARAADAPVKVRWVDAQGTLETGTWTPQ